MNDDSLPWSPAIIISAYSVFYRIAVGAAFGLAPPASER